MKLKPALQSSKGRSTPWGGARLINAFAEQSEGDKAELYAVQAIPGLNLFASVESLPVRGAHRMGTVLYSVVGTTLYSTDSAGVSTSRGTIPGTNPVRIADNGTELAIHDGGTTGYVYSGGAIHTPTNLPSVTDVAFIDGYFVWILSGTNQFTISGLNDGLTYDPLDIAPVEGAPGNLVAVVNDHRELIFFKGGDGSTPCAEIYVNTGNADFPFERQGNAFIERGIADRDSIAKMDNSTWFVGDDRIVYRMNGYTPERISTHAVEKTLAAATWFRAFTYSMEGHKFYLLNTDQGSWACDVATANAWAERKSFGVGYYRCGCSVTAYGKTLLGDNQTGKFYEPSFDASTENGALMPVTIELPPMGDGVNRQTLYALELFMETGVGDLTTANPQAILTYSKDGGRNWSNELMRTMGAQGTFTTRAVWRPNVEFRQLQLRFVFPDSVRRCALAYHADVR